MNWQTAMLDIIHNAKSLDEAREMADDAMLLAGAVTFRPPQDVSYREKAAVVRGAYKVMVSRRS